MAIPAGKAFRRGTKTISRKGANLGRCLVNRGRHTTCLLFAQLLWGAQRPFRPHLLRCKAGEKQGWPLSKASQRSAGAKGAERDRWPPMPSPRGCLCCLGQGEAAGSFGMARQAAGNRWGAGGVCALRAPAPPGGTLGARQRKRPGASRSEKSAVGLIQRRQGLLIRYLGGLQLLGPLGFHLLELGLDRLDLLLDLGGIFRVGGQACLHAG